MLRRFISILLFAATILPLVAPVLASAAVAGSTLPACCRRGGKHQCAMLAGSSMAGMTSAQQQASKQPTLRAPLELCPYRQHSLGAVHLQPFAAHARNVHAAGIVRAPSIAAQAECLRRISFDRSRQKRGPPSLIG